MLTCEQTTREPRLAGESGEELPRMSNRQLRAVRQRPTDHHQIFRVEEDLTEEVDLATSEPQELARLKSLLAERYVELLAGSFVWEAAE